MKMVLLITRGGERGDESEDFKRFLGLPPVDQLEYATLEYNRWRVFNGDKSVEYDPSVIQDWLEEHGMRRKFYYSFAITTADETSSGAYNVVLEFEVNDKMPTFEEQQVAIFRPR